MKTKVGDSCAYCYLSTCNGLKEPGKILDKLEICGKIDTIPMTTLITIAEN